MERLRKTARVLDVVARIAFWFTMVVGALLFLLWALNLRDPFFTSYMGGNVIVNVKEARVAISEEMARKIMV